jgi:hypothetical protein
LSLKVLFSEIASLRSVHDDMSAKPCDNCKMIMVNYADLWLIHSHVASLFDSVKLELRDIKARSTLLGACTSYPLLKSDLEASVVKIKNLKHKLDHSSRYTVLSPLYEACVSLKGKLFYATKENTEVKKKVAYLTAQFEKTKLSEKMVEEDLSQVEENATKSDYRLSVGFERCEDKGEKSTPKFILTPRTKKRRKQSNPLKLNTHPTQSHPSTLREK